jgi:hypothetical protein
VGKFITQSNDYFFPPSLSIVYGFFLLTVLVYLYFRRPQPPDPRQALYHSPEGLRDALDGDLNTEEAAQIEEELAIAKNSDRQEVAALAEAISRYLRVERRHLPEVEYGYWKWATTWVDGLGTRLGRARHRTVISLLLILWVVFPVGYVAVLIQGRATLDSQVVQWRGLLIAVQALVGVLMVVAVVVWLAGKEALGLKLSISGFLLSLVALQTLYFYLSQFSAIVATLLQIALLQILLVYRRRYLISHAVAT